MVKKTPKKRTLTDEQLYRFKEEVQEAINVIAKSVFVLNANMDAQNLVINAILDAFREDERYGGKIQQIDKINFTKH